MESHIPLVSIILPTYNRAYILPQTIKNILGQSWKDFELIVVDDCSKDNTDEVMAQMHDPRIVYVKREKNGGESAARNTGFRRARGAFIASQDSDDEWTDGKLEREMTALINADSRVGAVYSRVEKTFWDGRIMLLPDTTVKILNGNLYIEFLKKNVITIQAATMRRECYEAIDGFDESIPSFAEWDLWIRFSKKYEFIFIPEIGVRAHVLEDSVSRDIKKRLISREIIFLKHLSDFKRYPPLCASNAYAIGSTYAIQQNMKKARRYLGIAVASSPLTLKYLAAFFVSLFNSPRLYRSIGKWHGR